MRKNLIPTVLAVLGMAAVSMTFQNCGPQGLLQYDEASNSPITSPGEIDTATAIDQNNAMKLMTGDQVYRSMASLTGIPTDNAATTAAFNAAGASLADNFSLSSISAPLLLNLTNLGANFCTQAIIVESAAGANRRLFVGVNFAAAVAQLSGATYTTFIQNMSQQLWGRALSANEETVLNQFRTEAVAAIAANQVANVAQTRNLALGVCTAMISANDAFTF